jgi:Protein of unknown function (DUF3551)
MMEVTMRIAFAALALLAAGAAFDDAKADPYCWCAHYSGNGSNCYFMSLEQGRWAVSGVGGSCGLNPFYDGVPIDSVSAPRVRRR